MVEGVLHRLLGTYANCVSRFVVPSQFYIDKLCDWGWSRSMFRHVPNFVDVRGYRPQYAPGRNILYFGRLSPEKGLTTLIHAAAASRSRLQLAGTGPQATELRRLVTQLDADVTFLGYLTGEALHDAIRSARAVVLPSEWYENAPVSVLEAYALGKPVLGARIGGIPELIREQETGLGFISGDIGSLSATLRDIAERSDAAIEDMGRRARIWVEEVFTAASYRNKIVSIYQELGVPSAGPNQTLATA
jgi:glycosyltransferase involved in cell wall biosynthesis